MYAPFRREGTLRDYTRPAYVINREQIEPQGAKTAQEALKLLPGILSDGTAGGQLGAVSSQFIRGANSAHVLMLLDGRSISDICFFISVNLRVSQDFSNLVNSSFTSPSVGAGLMLGETTIPRGNYARSFRVPQIVNLEGLSSFNVVGNPDLKPERGKSFDVGIDQQLGDIGLLRLAYFQNNISDLINFKVASPNSTYENIGRVRTTGLEADLNVEGAKNLYAFANYTLNNPELVDDRNANLKGNELS